MSVVGRSVFSDCPVTAERSSVGSTVTSSTCRVEKRYMAVSRSLALTRGMVWTGRGFCCHQSGSASSRAPSPSETKR